MKNESCCIICKKAFKQGDKLQAFLRCPEDTKGGWTAIVEVDSMFQERHARNQDSFKRKHEYCIPNSIHGKHKPIPTW